MASRNLLNRAISLAGKGFSPEEIAAANNVHVTKIRELLSREDVSARITDVSGDRVDRALDEQETFDRIRHDALRRLLAQLPEASVAELTRITDVLHRVEPKSPVPRKEADNGTTFVKISVPSSVRAQIGISIGANENGQLKNIGDAKFDTIGQEGFDELIRARNQRNASPTSDEESSAYGWDELSAEEDDL